MSCEPWFGRFGRTASEQKTGTETRPEWKQRGIEQDVFRITGERNVEAMARGKESVYVEHVQY